jgi:hypothetical protein
MAIAACATPQAVSAIGMSARHMNLRCASQICLTTIIYVAAAYQNDMRMSNLSLFRA